MSDDDVFHRVSMVMNVDPAEIAKIVHDYIERGIINDYDRLNCPKPPIYIGPVKVKTLKEKIDNYKKEETKMKATSTEEFKDIIAIDFELQTFPNPDVQDKFIVSATNRDDIFCFVFEGPHIEDTCRKAGLFSSWEKDQKIRELEEELGRWKKEAADCLRLRDEARKENKKLKQQLQQVERDKKRLTGRYEGLDSCYNGLLKDYHQLKDKLDLERAANEAQHKFFRQYAGKGTEIEFNYAIGDDDETTYVIVDKEEYKALKNIQNNVKDNSSYVAMIHGKVYNPAQLVDRILELEALKTPTIENFTNEEPADNVNHPSHYTGRYECIDVMQDVFGDEATDNFCLCNAFKYIWRARKKNGLEDVKKAVWYLNKYIEEAEKDGIRKGEQI